MTNLKIYIVAPPKVYTGGPTALFQLCHELNKFAREVECIIAFDSQVYSEHPVHPAYKKYKCKWIWVSQVPDNSNSMIIVPETKIHLLYRFNKVRKAIYWLAVDNFVLTWLRGITIYDKIFEKIKKNVLRIEAFLRTGILSLRTTDFYHYYVLRGVTSLFKDYKLIKILNEDVEIHLAQSIYAFKFLSALNIHPDKIVIIHEPIEDVYIRMSRSSIDIRTLKKNVIAFNARKAFSVAYRAISLVNKLRPQIKIIPLYNVGRENMLKILQRSKVFVDVGIHPGRDRPPREAVVLDNIVIVNRTGGCYYWEDCPVPEKYAVNCKNVACQDLKPNQLASLIIEAIDNYDSDINLFTPFKQYVLREPSVFQQDIKNLYSKII